MTREFLTAPTPVTYPADGTAVPGQRAAVPRQATGVRQDGVPPASGGTPPGARHGVADMAEAEEFLRLFYGEQPRQPRSLDERLWEVWEAIAATGTYHHTAQELTFGARVAWRNSSRCIGRLYWNSLQVLDRRAATTPEEIHHGLCEHLRLATNGGRIRPVLSVFAPETPGRPAPRVWNDQLIRYAGHRLPDGRVLGDPGYADFTDMVRELGWQPPGGAYDVLPLVIEAAAEQKPQLFDVPRELVLEVPIVHPERPEISNMRLRIGGVDYPLAPFNGWYMGTEIGARNLVDEDRYNLLPVIAERLGLDTSRETTLWRDRALVELNVAVLHSFEAAGVRVSDHHTESRHFLTHLAKEERQGRTVPTDWSWIVPPVSGGITPVFHRYYDEGELRPNFHLDEDARTRGRGRCPYQG